MSRFTLIQLSTKYDQNVYDMLQRIGKCENEFKNSANGLSPWSFKEWLIMQDAWSRGEQLPAGYVPQTIFWLYNKEQIVGIGKIRHALNHNSRTIGGNIGYAIDPLYRGMGYATILLKLLIDKAKEMEIKELLLTVEKCNPASKRVIEKAGGRLIKESNERWYFEL